MLLYGRYEIIKKIHISNSEINVINGIDTEKRNDKRKYYNKMVRKNLII